MYNVIRDIQGKVPTEGYSVIKGEVLPNGSPAGAFVVVCRDLPVEEARTVRDRLNAGEKEMHHVSKRLQAERLAIAIKYTVDDARQANRTLIESFKDQAFGHVYGPAARSSRDKSMRKARDLKAQLKELTK